MPLLSIDVPETTEALALALELPAGICQLAHAERAAGGVQVSELAGAIADWARSQGRVLVEARGLHSDCDGGPKVTPLTVPAGGWAIGLTQPPLAVRTEGISSSDVVALGEDRRWWHVPPAAADLAFVFGGGQPPALFAITPDPMLVPPPGWAVELTQGEAREAPAEATPIAAAVEPPTVARVVGWGDRVVVVGVLPGTADGQLREGDAAPHSVHAVVLKSTRPPLAVTTRVGRSRRVVLDGPAPTDVLALDPAYATATLERGALRVTGAAGGLGTVLVRAADGSLVVLTVLVD